MRLRLSTRLVIVSAMEIFILECDHTLFMGTRKDFYVIGKENAHEEYESAKKEGLRPHLYTTDIAPTGLIMRGEYIK